MSFRTRSRRRVPSLVVVLAMVIGLLPLAAAPALAALNGAAHVAYDMMDSTSLNLTSYTNPWTDAFSAGGDAFQKFDRDINEGDIPYAVADDTLVGYPTDAAGIIDENFRDEFFGISDTVNGDTTDPVVATWVFDVSGGPDSLQLSIDLGAMGDFEAADSFVFTYDFDGGTAETAFTSSVDEDGSLDYTLANGTTVTTLADPLSMNGTQLNNVLQTLTVPLTGSGDALTLTLTAITDGGSEAFAFSDIVIDAYVPPFESAYDMVGSADQNLISYTNPWTDAFSAGGDAFQKFDRDINEGDIPYAVADDTLVGYPTDAAGIIDENFRDEFFGISDTVNGDTTDPVVATWVFNIAGGSNLALSIDMGAMGDFEAADSFVFTYSIDGGTAETAFTSSVDEDGSLDYTLANGTTVTTLADPLSMNGTQLNNVLQTLKTNIGGTGDALTLTLTVTTDGGSEAFAFSDILIDQTGGVVEPPDVYLSEIHYDNDGADVGEFVEVTGDAGTDLSTWFIELYNGSNGTRYANIALSGTIPDESGGMGALSFPYSGIQNGGPDGFALVDNNGVVLEFLSYEGSFDATDQTAIGMTSIDIGVAEAGSTPVGQSLQLIDDAWVGPQEDSPGLLNTAVVAPFDCGDPATLISEVQGSGAVSPLDGTVVDIEGIVVGDFQAYGGAGGDEALGGFMLQEEDFQADGNPATSEGVFVYDPAGTDVAVGDLVRVRGTVDEYNDLTEVKSVTGLLVCASGQPLPAAGMPIVPTSLADPVVDWESFEGMHVVFAQPLFVTETYRLGSFGEVVLSATGPQDQPNQVAPVGSPAATDVRTLNERSRVVLDDGEDENEGFPNETWNPTVTPYLQNGGVTLRGGDSITGLAGAVHHAWDDYEIHPVNVADPLDPAAAVTFTTFETRPFIPDIYGTFTVASFNVLNYFTTMDSRGADNPAEFVRQADKIIEAIIAIDADVVGLMEIENNGTAIADLVGKLNAAAGATRTYGYIDTGVVGADAITVGFIYDTATAAPEGPFAILDDTVSPAFIEAKNRPAVAQTFAEVGSTGMVTVAVNHLKSKGSDCDTVVNPGDPAYGVLPYATDPDTGVYAGNCNLTRTAGAAVLGQWLANDPTGTGAPFRLIIGDLNSYRYEDPITALEGLGYTNLQDTYSLGSGWQMGGHTYVYDGEYGSLDYALADEATLGAVVWAGAWHLNSDEPPALDYNDYNPAANYVADEYRASDHDPVVVGLAMTPKAMKQGTIPELAAAVALGTRLDQRRILRAIRNINRSLVESRWTTDSSLDSRTGVLVFRRQREAIIRLLALSPAVSDIGENAVRQLIGADRELARLAIEDALSKGKGILRAQLWFDRGDTAYGEGDLELAFRCFSMAWWHATR